MSGYSLPGYFPPIYNTSTSLPAAGTVTPFPTAAIAQDTGLLYLFNVNAGTWGLMSNPQYPSYTTTASAAGTTTLTVASTPVQYITGVTTQSVVLPVTSTLVLGQPYTVTNLSTGVVTVKSSGGNTILAMVAGSTATFQAISLSGTGASSWNIIGAAGQYLENNCASGSAVSVTSGTVTDADSGGGSAVGIILPAGTWDIAFNASFIVAASTSVTKLSAWVGTATGNATTGQDLARNYGAVASAANVMSGTQTISIAPYRVVIATPTTYYLKVTGTFTVSTLTAYGTIRATQIY